MHLMKPPLSYNLSRLVDRIHFNDLNLNITKFYCYGSNDQAIS
uniref:Uncharacterized protein n=1 Tax=Parascaris equorum TaxID=6256 RepID=A0A914RBV0_PAREQ